MDSSGGTTFSRIKDYYETVVDYRTDKLFLGSSPYPTIIIIAWYLVMVKYVLPAYMKNRPAYQLSSVLFYYNIFQVWLSAYIVYMSFIASGYGKRYSFFRCRELVQSTTDSDSMAAMHAVHLYFLAKFTEFLDTFFFLLRKKDNQISFLHVYHHATMPINSWLVLRVTPGGSSVMAAGMNSSIHVIMYTYYLLSGLGPKYQKYLWWKKYMTTAQIIQFCYGLFCIVIIFLTRNECPNYCLRAPFILYAAVYITSLVVLFSKFYYKEYNKKKV